nr:helix-turn-helix domain-containing protein [Kitasatospora cineracea]
MKPAEVARRLRVSLKSAYRWHQLWRESGVEALASRGPAPAPGCATACAPTPQTRAGAAARASGTPSPWSTASTSSSRRRSCWYGTD